MEVITSLPPMFEEIDAAFHVRGKPVIFTWGFSIYNPENIEITPELLAHERVHAARQTDLFRSIERWWQSYIADPEFRLAEELPAHRAEYQKFCRLHSDRNARARCVKALTMRLAGPLYGGIISEVKACKLLRAK
jgi:hypothetical protein